MLLRRIYNMSNDTQISRNTNIKTKKGNLLINKTHDDEQTYYSDFRYDYSSNHDKVKTHGVVFDRLVFSDILKCQSNETYHTENMNIITNHLTPAFNKQLNFNQKMSIYNKIEKAFLLNDGIMLDKFNIEQYKIFKNFIFDNYDNFYYEYTTNQFIDIVKYMNAYFYNDFIISLYNNYKKMDYDYKNILTHFDDVKLEIAYNIVNNKDSNVDENMRRFLENHINDFEENFMKDYINNFYINDMMCYSSTLFKINSDKLHHQIMLKILKTDFGNNRTISEKLLYHELGNKKLYNYIMEHYVIYLEEISTIIIENEHFIKFMIYHMDKTNKRSKKIFSENRSKFINILNVYKEILIKINMITTLFYEKGNRLNNLNMHYIDKIKQIVKKCFFNNPFFVLKIVLYVEGHNYRDMLFMEKILLYIFDISYDDIQYYEFCKKLMMIDSSNFQYFVTSKNLYHSSPINIIGKILNKEYYCIRSKQKLPIDSDIHRYIFLHIIDSSYLKNNMNSIEDVENIIDLIGIHGYYKKISTNQLRVIICKLYEMIRDTGYVDDKKAVKAANIIRKNEKIYLQFLNMILSAPYSSDDVKYYYDFIINIVDKIFDEKLADVLMNNKFYQNFSTKHCNLSQIAIYFIIKFNNLKDKKYSKYSEKICKYVLKMKSNHGLLNKKYVEMNHIEKFNNFLIDNYNSINIDKTIKNKSIKYKFYYDLSDKYFIKMINDLNKIGTSKYLDNLVKYICSADGVDNILLTDNNDIMLSNNITNWIQKDEKLATTIMKKFSVHCSFENLYDQIWKIDMTNISYKIDDKEVMKLLIMFGFNKYLHSGNNISSAYCFKIGNITFKIPKKYNTLISQDMISYIYDYIEMNDFTDEFKIKAYNQYMKLKTKYYITKQKTKFNDMKYIDFYDKFKHISKNTIKDDYRYNMTNSYAFYFQYSLFKAYHVIKDFLIPYNIGQDVVHDAFFSEDGIYTILHNNYDEHHYIKRFYSQMIQSMKIYDDFYFMINGIVEYDMNKFIGTSESDDIKIIKIMTYMFITFKTRSYCYRDLRHYKGEYNGILSSFGLHMISNYMEM